MEDTYEKEINWYLDLYAAVWDNHTNNISTQPISNEIKHLGSCYIVAEGTHTEKDFPSIVGASIAGWIPFPNF
jgi:hypothetical protein